METPLLRDPLHLPTDEYIQQHLGISFQAFSEMMKTITNNKNGLTPEWNYYKDGKAWLCKVVYKKKTVFWLSVWEAFFKATFYFTEKNCEGVYSLSIDESVKEAFMSAKHVGKFMPLTLIISKPDQIDNLLKIIDYKKNLK